MCFVMKISSTRLRTDSSKLVMAVKNGKTGVITYHGKAVAKVMPTEESKDSDSRERALNEFIAAFKSGEPQENPAEIVRKLRRSRRNRQNTI